MKNIDGEMWFTDWGQEYGRMRSEARIQGLLKALRTIARVRGLDPTEAQWARIERCRSTKQLLRYIARASVATTVGQLFRRSPDYPADEPFERSKEGPWVLLVLGQDEHTSPTVGTSSKTRAGSPRVRPPRLDRKDARKDDCSA